MYNKNILKEVGKDTCGDVSDALLGLGYRKTPTMEPTCTGCCFFVIGSAASRGCAIQGLYTPFDGGWYHKKHIYKKPRLTKTNMKHDLEMILTLYKLHS